MTPHPQSSSTGRDRPNILWICTDSQRFDALGCYGNPWVHTPAIDRLAREGVLFENAFAQNPLCTPSRGCFLTGRYPVTNRLRQNGQDIPENEVLVTKLLDEAGYVCGLSGKLHLSACDNRIKFFGRDSTQWAEVQDQRRFFRGIERRIDDGYTEFHWDHAPTPHFSSSSYNRWVAEQGAEINTPAREDCRYVRVGMPSRLHQTTFCVEKAMGFIDAYKDAPYPWLFSVNIFDPHFAVDPPSDYLEPYLERLEDIPLPAYVEGELEDKPPYQSEFTRGHRYDPRNMTERDHRLIRAGYFAMVDHIDYQIGRLLDHLDDTGQRENTVVIFTSDHGEMLGDHNIYIKGPFLYDPAIRVPLIVSFPGIIDGGRHTDALVELGDLAPTVLEATGTPRHPGIQTRSLWPFLARADEHSDDFREDVYCEYYNSNPNKPAQYCTMVRTKKHKLVVMHGQDTGELYDLENDPGEHRNLWSDGRYRETKTALLLRLTDRMAYTADPLPERVGIY